MNSPSEDVKDILENAGVGTLANDLFVGKEPIADQTQDAVVTIYDTGGSAPEVAASIGHPSVMVRIRGAKGGYREAYTKAESVKTALHGLNNESWGSARYIQILAQSDILFNGFDEKDRPIFTINFSIQRT